MKTKICTHHLQLNRGASDFKVKLSFTVVNDRMEMFTTELMIINFDFYWLLIIQSNVAEVVKVHLEENLVGG